MTDNALSMGPRELLWAICVELAAMGAWHGDWLTVWWQQTTDAHAMASLLQLMRDPNTIRAWDAVAIAKDPVVASGWIRDMIGYMPTCGMLVRQVAPSLLGAHLAAMGKGWSR